MIFIKELISLYSIFKNVSLKEIARAVNVKYVTVRKWASGVVVPNEKNLFYLSQYFGVDRLTFWADNGTDKAVKVHEFIDGVLYE